MQFYLEKANCILKRRKILGLDVIYRLEKVCKKRTERYAEITQKEPDCVEGKGEKQSQGYKCNSSLYKMSVLKAIPPGGITKRRY